MMFFFAPVFGHDFSLEIINLLLNLIFTKCIFIQNDGSVSINKMRWPESGLDLLNMSAELNISNVLGDTVTGAAALQDNIKTEVQVDQPDIATACQVHNIYW